MRNLTRSIAGALALVTATMFTFPAWSDPGRDGHTHPHATGSAHHGHGGPHMRGYPRGRSMGMARTQWWHTLSDEQRAQLERLRLRKMKGMLGLKAKKRAIKSELALLVTGASPSNSAINAKIEEYLKIKRQMMQLRYNHLVLVRKVLNPVQRTSFDLYILKKSQRHKRKHRRHRW